MTNPFALDTPAGSVATAPPPLAQPTIPTQPTAPAAAPAAPVAGGDPFDAPAPREARGPRLRDMYGRLLLVIPHKLEEGIPNRLDKKGGTQDRMTADVVILDGGTIHYGGAPEETPPVAHTKAAEAPLKNARMFVSSVGLISQCRVALAKKVATGQSGMVLGRLATGDKKEPGHNAPWLLTLPTEADKVIARQYLANVDPFA